MKKLSLLFILVIAVVLVQAQTDVVVTIDVSADSDITSVMFKGTPTGWANVQGYDDGTNGDATAGDNIWSATMNVACDGTTHEWGAVDQNDAWLLEGFPNPQFVADAGCAVTGQTSHTIPMTGGAVPVTLTVTDSNSDIGGISFKGAYDGWSSVAGYDDGTNGDMMAGDGIWTLQVMADMPQAGDDPITYEWGADRTDCASPAWIIIGPNRAFTVDDQGNVSGDTDYTVPTASTTYMVTFRVYMGNEIVSSEGVYVSGAFETCPWSKQDIQMQPSASDPTVYEATTPVAPGMYQWKFFNGGPGTDDGGEGGGGTPFATVFVDEGCGVDNGLGGSNRESDWSALSADAILPIYTFNSCDDSYIATSNSDVLELDKFEIKPNPFSDRTVIEFSNDEGASYDLTVTNMTGQVITSVNNVTGNIVELSADNMGAGIYFATLTDAEGRRLTRRLVVQ